MELQIHTALGLSRGRLVRGYPSKNAGAGIPDLVPGPVLVPAKSARKESNAAFKFLTNPSRVRLPSSESLFGDGFRSLSALTQWRVSLLSPRKY